MNGPTDPNARQPTVPSGSSREIVGAGVVRWDPGHDLAEVAALWGADARDLRNDLAGLPAGIDPVAVVDPSGGSADRRLLVVALYVPSTVTRLPKASLARVAFAPGVGAERAGALVAWGERRARDEGAATLEVVERRAPGIQSLLEARGYKASNALIRMRRTVRRSVPPLGSGLVELPVSAAGVDAWVRVYNASFAGVAFSAPTTRDECSQALRDPGTDPELIRIVLAGSDPVAFLSAALYADGTGEVRAIGVDPAAQGRGLGRWILRRSEELLDARGAREVILRVAESNRTARALYEAEGYEEVSRNAAWSLSLLPGST